MSIQIKQYNDNMRIEIKEVFEFEKNDDFNKTLQKLLEIKRSYGKISTFKKNNED